MKYLAGAQVYDYIGKGKSGACFSKAAQHGFYAGQYFAALEWLDNIIICAQLQPVNLVFDSSFCGKENHRDIHGTYIFDQFIAVDFGQHNIQQHQIKAGIFFQQVGGLPAVIGTGAFVPFITQILA